MTPIRAPQPPVDDDDERTIEASEQPTVLKKIDVTSDEEPTVLKKLEADSEDPTVSAQVEAQKDDPTVSAQVDVRAAFAAQDQMFPKAAAALAPIDERMDRQEHTVPFRSPVAAPPPPRASAPVVAVAPSAPVAPFVAAAEPAEEPPIEIPGVDGTQRRRMLRIVIGVLSVCGLLCVAAVARPFLGGRPSTANAAPSATASASAIPTEASDRPAVTASAEPAAPTPSASVAASSASVATAPPAPIAPSRRPEARGPVVPPRPAPTKPSGRAPIVRDSPF